MSTTRVATFAAILGGSLLGALSAAVSVAWSPSVTAEPDPLPLPPPPERATASKPPPSKPSVPPKASIPKASIPKESAASSSASALETEGPLPKWLEDPLPAELAAVEAAAINCARGNPVDCMRAGDAYEEGRGVHPDATNARLNRKAGGRLFNKACKRRRPEACYALSVMYTMGQGVPRDPDIAQGMVMRTRELCATVESEVCSRLPPLDKE